MGVIVVLMLLLYLPGCLDLFTSNATFKVEVMCIEFENKILKAFEKITFDVWRNYFLVHSNIDFRKRKTF